LLRKIGCKKPLDICNIRRNIFLSEIFSGFYELRTIHVLLFGSTVFQYTTPCHTMARSAVCDLTMRMRVRVRVRVRMRVAMTVNVTVREKG
jgi:hypothetical protein